MTGGRNNLTELIDVVGLEDNNKSELKSKSGKCNKAYANVTPKFECGKRVKFILIKKKSGQLLCAGSSGPSLVRRLHLPGGMVLWATMLVLYGVGFVGKYLQKHIFTLFIYLVNNIVNSMSLSLIIK